MSKRTETDTFGKIDVDSYPGHTEFVIYIPIDRKETDDDE